MEKVIWNDDRSMNFLASRYISGSIYRPNNSTDDTEYNTKYKVRVHLEGTRPVPGRVGQWYATCSNEEEAKECLARLTRKLVLAGVIEVTEEESTDRFDHVDLREGNNEND